MVVHTAGEHNLSIALRHILQQIVESMHPNGHKHTDMTLPHDGYIQKLSWYFECDKCQYKAFYSHEMEHHKHICIMSQDFRSHTKKRKVNAPKRVSSTTHPRNEDSDPDSQSAVLLSAPPVPPPLKAGFSLSNPTSSQASSNNTSTPVATSSMPTLTTNPADSNIVSMEPASLEFDSEMASPGYIDIPPVVDKDSETPSGLDFEDVPNKDEPETERDSESEQRPSDDPTEQQPFEFDPDILEIKVEVGEQDGASRNKELDMNVLPDVVFPPSDPSIDSMMNIFNSQTMTPSQSINPLPTTSTSQHMYKKETPSRPDFVMGPLSGIKIPTGPISSTYPSMTPNQHIYRPQFHSQPTPSQSSQKSRNSCNLTNPATQLHKTVPRPFRSEVWKYFETLAEGSVENSRDFTVCRACRQVIKSTGGNTSNMINHLKRQHGVTIVSTRVWSKPTIKTLTNLKNIG